MEAQQIIQQVMAEIEGGTLAMPTLPAMAQKILKASQNDTLTTDTLAALIEQDPSIAAHLVRISNSPLVGCTTEVTDLRTAIGLFGLSYCSQLAISLALKQLFRAQKHSIHELIETTWQDSSKLAALCMAMAKDYKINAGSAYLAGLLHKIGALPILRWLDQQAELQLSKTEAKALIDQHQAVLAEQLLRYWQFPESLCSVPHNYQNMDHNSKEKVDFTDLVASAYHFLSAAKKDWQDCSVLNRLEIAADEMQKRMMAWQSLAMQTSS